MHEKELVESSLGTLNRLTRGRGIRSVEIAIGPGVDQYEAELAWKTLTAQSPLALTHVTWERAYDLLVCDALGHRYSGEAMETCPYCGRDGVVIEPAAPITVGRWELEPTETGSITRQDQHLSRSDESVMAVVPVIDDAASTGDGVSEEDVPFAGGFEQVDGRFDLETRWQVV